MLVIARPLVDLVPASFSARNSVHLLNRPASIYSSPEKKKLSVSLNEGDLGEYATITRAYNRV